jgi:AcrR family transcriptional regulator
MAARLRIAHVACRPTGLYGVVVPRIYPSAKNKILDATERVILRDGPRGVSVDAVLREADVSKGGFFHHFSSKEALLGALMERLTSMIGEQVAASMLNDGQPGGRSLRAQIALAFDMPKSERERVRALVLALLTAVMEASGPVKQKARKANEDAIAVAQAEGADLGVALVVQLALDGYFLGESFGTLKLDANRKQAIRDTLMALVTNKAKGARHAT